MRLGICKKMNIFLAASLIMCLLGSSTLVSASVVTGDTALGGGAYYLSKFYETASEDTTAASLLSDPVTIPDGVAIANVNEYLNIRSGAGTEYGVVGYLPKNGMCIVKEVTDDGWASIESGAVKGYVSTDYLYMGDEGREKAESLACLMATVIGGTVNVRSTPNTSSDDNIIGQVAKGEALKVIEETVISKECDTTLWVKVYFDDDEAYISKTLVNVAYDWTRAVTISSIIGAGSTSGISALRAAIVIEAKKHIGLKYVWGGNSLTKGADCSGFCLAVYKKCGIDTSKLPRASYDIAASKRGRTVTLAQAKPGDLIFYGSSSGIDHVAMYIGDGYIIHEAGRAYGCKISKANYRTIKKIKNFLD